MLAATPSCAASCAPSYAVAAARPAVAAPSGTPSELLLVHEMGLRVRREPACRSTSASGATGTIAKNTVTHTAPRLSILECMVFLGQGEFFFP